MKKYFFALIGISVLQTVNATVKDSNVVISNAKELYLFDYNKKDNTVQIKEETTTTYQCTSYHTDIPIMEYYDNKTSIENVNILVSDKKAKGIIPKYEYYSVNDIFYSDAHICYFKLPLEKKGNTSEVTFAKTISDPRYFTTIYFSDDYAIASKTISVTIPKWMKVELKEFNFEGKGIKKTKEYDSKLDADIITYTIKNLTARQSESHCPGASYTEPHLLVLCKYADVPTGKITYFNNLSDQYDWYRSLTKDLDYNNATIKTKATEITNGVANDLDKIKKIFYWMHDNIRYIAFEDGIAGFKPEKAENVLQKKYGDCKGMANLTKALLKSIGFDARLCWIGTNHIAYDYSTPSIAVDNHMICALMYQGKTYFLDATENYIGFNEYAERIQGRQVLIEDGDKYIYTKVPITTYVQNLDLEKSKLTINGKNIEGTVYREWQGEEKENIFFELNAIKKENSTDAFINFLKKGNSDYFITNFKTSDLTNYDKPLTVNYQIAHNNAVSVFGNELYVDIDYRKELMSATIDIKERQLDYWFSYKLNTQIEVELTIPDGYAATAVPANVAIKTDDYEFSATILKLPNKLKYTKNIIFKNPHLKKTKFEQWNKDIEKLTAFYNEQIILTKK